MNQKMFDQIDPTTLEDEIGDMHLSTSVDTPMRPDAFDLSPDEKIAQIETYFHGIMHTLGLDMEDDSLQGTPKRVAKMYVKELFSGLLPEKKPAPASFENSYNYRGMLVEKNIRVQSACEHHFLPIIGYAHVAYISSGKVIGLSKINRIVDYYSRRPQVQERLALQILNELKQSLQTEDVAIVLDAKHLCVSLRGIRDEHSSTITSEFSGRFQEKEVREEFLGYLTQDLSRTV